MLEIVLKITINLITNVLCFIFIKLVDSLAKNI